MTNRIFTCICSIGTLTGASGKHLSKVSGKKQERLIRKSEQGSSSVEFLFAFLLLFWMCLGFVDIVFQGYNGLIIDYGSWMGARGYIVDEPGGTHWKEGAETVGRGTMMHRVINAYLNGSEVKLEVTNREMLKSGIIYGTTREGTLTIGTDLGPQEAPFEGDNAP
ncbi:hypothetical protein [Desulfogranum japonicum]|uniref:hypothetical protein n=1 Tax=Desulfogranum japonicum TaxID=231447 RepID=UPI0004173C32|nr:hypothetical protein [Desulfogranum japonicum]